MSEATTMTDDVLLTSEAAREAGVSSATIRNWEARGLLPVAITTATGVKLVRRADVQRVAGEMRRRG